MLGEEAEEAQEAYSDLRTSAFQPLLSKLTVILLYFKS